MLCTWAAWAQMSDSEKRLADLIDCKQFKKNADGSWIGAPHAKIGKISDFACDVRTRIGSVSLPRL